MREQKIISQSNNFTKRDMVNSKAGYPLQDFDGQMEIKNVKAAAMTEVVEDGEKKEVSIIVTDDNQYYTSISATIYDSMPDIIDILDDETKVDLRIIKRESKSGREFLSVIVL